ncbi:MAG: response regulator [Pseudonocardiaceae bacterium]
MDPLLLDLQLPDASGLDGLRQLLRHGEAAVVVLTGLDDQYQGVAALGAGAQDYLGQGADRWAQSGPGDPLRGAETPSRGRELLRVVRLPIR